jgi:excisionase family DNA binding protein
LIKSDPSQKNNELENPGSVHATVLAIGFSSFPVGRVIKNKNRTNKKKNRLNKTFVCLTWIRLDNFSKNCNPEVMETIAQIESGHESPTFKAEEPQPQTLTVTIAQAACLLNVSEKTIRRWVDRGVFTCLPGIRKKLIPRRQIESLLRKCPPPFCPLVTDRIDK